MSELRERAKHAVPSLDAGAGLSAKKGNDVHHPGGPVKHSGLKQVLIAIALNSYFFLSCTSVFVGQILGCWLYFVDKGYYYRFMSVTKEFFGLLVNTITEWFSPALVRISGDASMKGQLRLSREGRLETKFPDRLVLISNHQIYTDWLYLWWIAYSSRRHGHLYIILKESLKYIPILGPGMMFYGFIFLARNWAKDKSRFHHRLQQLRTPQEGPLSGKQPMNPMWLLIFPEGTNLCPNGRKSSQKWAAKQGIPDMEHLLLPRTTGLQYCLQEVRGTVDWVYDCTLAYEGIPRGGYGQDVYSLRSTYLRGQGPKSLNMYWRRFAVKDIPFDDPKAFDVWLRDRWSEKDRFIEQYLQTGRMPEDESGGAGSSGYLETAVRNRSRFEFLLIFLALPPFAVVTYYLIALVKKYR